MRVLRKLAPVAALFTIAISAYCLDAERPRYDRNRQGQLWPEEANVKSSARNRAAKCGQLLMCTEGAWKLDWEPVSVPFWMLTGNRLAPAECKAAPAFQ